MRRVPDMRLYSRKRKSRFLWRVALCLETSWENFTMYTLTLFWHWQEDLFLHTEPPEIHHNHHVCVSTSLWLATSVLGKNLSYDLSGCTFLPGFGCSLGVTICPVILVLQEKYWYSICSIFSCVKFGSNGFQASCILKLKPKVQKSCFNF